MPTFSDSKQRILRLIFYIALAAWFYVIGIWLGPNKLTFGKYEGLTATDFVPIVETYCVPAVRAMKIYQRDHGYLPQREGDMRELFESKNDGSPGLSRLSMDGNYEYWGPGVMYRHRITYDFKPAHEGWFINGAYVNGPLPVPPVTLKGGEKSGLTK